MDARGGVLAEGGIGVGLVGLVSGRKALDQIQTNKYMYNLLTIIASIDFQAGNSPP